MQCSVLLLFIAAGVVTGAPNHLKAIAVETQYVPNVAVGAGGVSASWGGYSASAGLGGDVGNTRGGLYAAADSPHGRAAAGLGGSVGGSAQGGLYAGAEYPQDNAAAAEIGGYVDESFRGGVASPVEASQNNVAAPEVQGTVGGTVKGGFDTTANTRSSAGSSASADAGLGGSVYLTKGIQGTKVIQTQPGFLDRVFNIPISVLQAVNSYLNTKGHTKRVYVQGGASVAGAGHVPPSTNVGGEVAGGAQAEGSGYAEAPVVAQEVSTAQVSSSAQAYGSAETGGGLKVVTYETKPEVRSQIVGGSSAEGAIVVQKPPLNYDHIFNIPISALKSVNQLLNG